MKVLIFGATGMVGQGVLLECLRDSDVAQITTLGRTATENGDSRVSDIVRSNLTSFTGLVDRLSGFDACFFCLGISSAGMKEADYEQITYDITVAAAEFLSELNPGMNFLYVSGAGTDSSEHGAIMWARVKGRTENALLRLPLHAYMFRPGIIEPLDGIRSKTVAYRILYFIARPLLPLLRMILPKQILSTREIGQAMLKVARSGYGKRILETGDIRAVVKG